MREKLKKARENAGFTQEEFAKEIETPVATYQKYEQGVRTPKLNKMKLIMKQLNVHSLDIFDNK